MTYDNKMSKRTIVPPDQSIYWASNDTADDVATRFLSIPEDVMALIRERVDRRREQIRSNEAAARPFVATKNVAAFDI